MKQVIFLLISTVLVCTSHAQSFVYPNVPDKPAVFPDYIPAGWTILDSTRGDLNKDQLEDMVLVLQNRDSVTLTYPDTEYEEDTVITQPRMLLIIFRTPKGKYSLADRSNTFILNDDNPSLEDPYDDVSIENGILTIGFHLFANAGTWYTSATQYKFRYQTGSMALIGAESKSLHRATLDYEDRSYNFPTRKWSLVKGNASNDEEEKPEPEWHNLQLSELKTFKTFLKPYTWEVTEDIYL
jgi:hypothetical protein